MKPVVDMPVQRPIVVITRLLDAPPALVWEAFTTPEHVVKWFGGDGFTSPSCQMDVRPGGLWKHVLRAPDGSEFAVASVFLEVDPPRLLSWKNAAEPGPGAPPAVQHTVTLEAVGQKTRWKLVAEFRTTQDRETSVRMGFAVVITQSIERLAHFVETAAAGASHE